NTIVNRDGIWPLEFTCRFGYPGFAILTPLQATSWGALFKTMISRQGTLETRSGFCVGIVLTTPPFPYNRKLIDTPIGVPVILENLQEHEKSHIHLGEVGLENGELVTSGLFGWTMVVTGTGKTIEEAKTAAIALARKVHVANLRYRSDIGAKLLAGDFD